MQLDPFLLDWLNILVRWGHLIAGISWIGTSFYFVALDLSLRKDVPLPKGVAGEAWEVHGGGFYHVQKYLSAPDNLPPHLIWFKWEAYLTWITGFLLLIIQYYVQADIYLVDPAVMPLNAWQASGISIGSLIAGWFIYDALCRSPIGKSTGVLALCVYAMIVAASWGFSHVFSGRGAFIHVGAFIGTIMATNVFGVIIPNQGKITASLLKGEVPDPKYGVIGKQRSTHNTYLTLPVLFMMTSNHYAVITGYPQAWALVGIIVLFGGLGRYFLLRHEVGDSMDKIGWAVPVIMLLLAGAMLLTQPSSKPALNIQVSDDQALSIVTQRCAACHSAKPTDPTIKEAPKGIMFASVDDLKRYAVQIDAQAVRNHSMPLGNKTGMTQDERDQLGAWIAKLK
ncbi:urate hydroxylase PuuD [Aestuariivirga litoralis]|uniref:urate hydroxylase PuuD n=1 Tax=Aestuariivirga litoralis TaxID=2650924 RepID=UPI0018C8137B|nr:urate hydroxylase PuuD [Aestuariivirga litoralis]MBG1232625.1 cysteine desulfurase [Aestuariivirga litoralis]